MTPEGAVRAQLLATAAVTALVSTRVYLDTAPQGIATSYLLVRAIDEPRDYHLRGEVVLSRARITVEAGVFESTTTRPDLDALSVAAHAAISGRRFTQGDRSVTGVFCVDRRPVYDPDELRLMRMIQDYYVWSEAA